MYFLDDQLLVSIQSRYKGFVTLSEDLQEMNLIVLKGILNHSNPDSYKLRKVLIYNNKPVFYITGNLYNADDNFTKWSYFYQDTTFMNAHDPDYYKRRGGIWPSTFYVLNNELFANYVKNQENRWSYSDLGIKKYEAEPVDTFKVFNNIFDNDYHTMRYFSSPNQRYDGIQGVLYNANPCILDKSIIVKAGLVKSLLQTQDNGKTWELVSYLTGRPKAILNDSTYIFFNDNPKVNEVNRTEDYGNTFLPTIIPDVSDSILFDMSMYKSNSIFYLDNTGKGFLSGRKSEVFKSYIAYTEDGGKTYRYLFSKNDFKSLGSNVCKLDGKYLFATSSTSGILYNITCFIDTGFANINYLPYDSLFVVHYILGDNFEHYYRFATAKDIHNTPKGWFEVHETSDSGKTYTVILKLDHLLDIAQLYEHNTDSLFFATKNPARLYLYDRQRNAIDTLFIADDKDSVLVMLLGGKFYILGEKLFLENTDRMDLTQWQPAKWDYGTPSFESVLFKGNVALARLSDDKRPWNNYRIMPEGLTSVDEGVKPEIGYYTSHFYASAPWPLPAHSEVRVKVSWDMSFDLVEAVQGVYSIYGELFDRKDKIKFENLTRNTADIIWDCSSAPSGSYFILVRHNGITDCIPVIVRK